MTPGDQLVQVNGENVQGVPHSEVVEKLHAISRSGQPLAMIVARVRPQLASLRQQHQPHQQEQKQSVQKEAEADRQETEDVVDGTGSVEDDEPDSSEDEEDTEAVS